MRKGGLFLWLCCLAAQAELITTSPQLTELFYQLGLSQKLVATVFPNHYPKAAQALPTVGNVYSPSVEKTLAFQPQRVIGDPIVDPSYFQRALRNQARYHAHSLLTLQGLVRQSAVWVNAYGGNPATLEKLRRCVSHLPQSPPFRFLILIWSDPAILVGQSTFLSDLIIQLGGQNLMPQGPAPYPQVSKEWLLAQRPDRIFHFKEVVLPKPLQRVWKGIPTQAIETDLFARASLTPLIHLEKLGLGPAPESCHGLQAS